MSKRTSKKMYAFNGKTQTLYEWADDTGIPFETLRYRLMRGWSLEDCFTRPARKWQKRAPGQKNTQKVLSLRDAACQTARNARSLIASITAYQPKKKAHT